MTINMTMTINLTIAITITLTMAFNVTLTITIIKKVGLLLGLPELRNLATTNEHGGKSALRL